jgi:2-iminobutanoate/2-iminopropanoate deaminase
MDDSATTALISAAGVRSIASSQVITAELGQAARLVFVSGQVARDEAGDVIGEGDFEVQCRYVFNRLSSLLTQVGSSMHNVLKVTIFLRDFSSYKKLVEIRREFWSPEHPPASSAVAVTSLVDDRLLIEVEAIALVAAHGA